MTLKELADVQRRFDEQHESDFQWDTMISQDNIPMLGFTLIVLSGGSRRGIQSSKKMREGIAPYVRGGPIYKRKLRIYFCISSEVDISA